MTSRAPTDVSVGRKFQRWKMSDNWGPHELNKNKIFSFWIVGPSNSAQGIISWLECGKWWRFNSTINCSGNTKRAPKQSWSDELHLSESLGTVTWGACSENRWDGTKDRSAYSQHWLTERKQFSVTSMALWLLNSASRLSKWNVLDYEIFPHRSYLFFK